MVGVPHSTGCALCRERRIKCDQAKPQCSQCLKFRRPCPGYRRTYRFQDERPALERRHQLSTSPRSSVDGANELRQAVPSDDEQHQPAQHQPVSFMRFITNAFPIFHEINSFRATDYPNLSAHINFSADRSFYLAAAAHCVSLVFQEISGMEDSLLNNGRHTYNHAIHAVRQASSLEQSSNKAEVLGAIILLSIYEMRVQTIPDGWLNHAQGVEAIMEELGAQAHTYGFARACYIFFRGFLIAYALQRGQPCFLEKEEWQQLAERIRSEDSQKLGNDAAFVDVTERIFTEFVKFPRYTYEAQLQSRVPNDREAFHLLSRILDSRKELQLLLSELKDLITADLARENSTASQEDTLNAPTLLLHGVESALVLSHDLEDRVAMTPVPLFRVSPGLTRIIETGAIVRDASWLDQMACSMGLLGARVVDGNTP
ncbi:hypothetical protein BDV23DRAFT_181260 [Aspergillus alliaceus]|uniref:Zn(2)-C6 fungal-type domain-containing protein n=1 Tax=Petromyces alliaceus TaxID=209559 RepID=A0A5N7CFC5_PETAA|nr:hypothetical protein BDV23DRAFT_181260 [Aspergillus alliaceus]